ncbi:hypothetical protein [Phytobacter diazotrophicus]|uniref:hypothetical protein n=1 Tax=Phytobacter diazotrophicus TaxID=395631 RepID=UPI003075F5D5
MKSGLTITTDNADAVLAALAKLSGMDVLVGIPEGNAAREDGAPYNNAELGYLQSVGATIQIPEHTTTIYRQVDANGDLKNDGRFVKARKSNLATTHIVPAQTVTLPPRPFLDIGIEDTQERTTAHLKAAAQYALEGKAEGAERELNNAGQIASDGAKAVIEAGDRLAPLSEKTIQKRREAKPPIAGDKPLRARGYLLRSITYVVRKK